MIVDSRKNKLVKVNVKDLKAELKRKCADGLPWSVRCDQIGIGNTWIQNGVYKYAKVESDDRMIYGYVIDEKYEKACGAFDIDPTKYCEEWADYKCIKQEKQDKPAERAEKTVDDDLLAVLREISGNLAEINANIVRLGNVQMQIFEKMQRPTGKPVANNPRFMINN